MLIISPASRQDCSRAVVVIPWCFASSSCSCDIAKDVLTRSEAGLILIRAERKHLFTKEKTPVYTTNKAFGVCLLPGSHLMLQ